MLESAWLFVGFVGVLITAAALYTNDNALAIVLGVLGTVTWVIWTYGAFDVTVVDGGVELSFSEPAIAIFGIMMGLVPLYIALTGPIEAAKGAVETRPDEL